MFNKKEKIKVKLGFGVNTFNDSSTGFFINSGEEKEIELTKNIKESLDKEILIRIHKIK